jgi:RHS repeat-associated protein
MPYKRSVLRFMVPIPLGAMLALWLFGSSVAAQPPVATPTHCETVYAVHDEGTQHSQFFSYQLQSSTLTPLGPLHKRKDIEGLSVNPLTQVLYATSGKPNSILYVVDADTGEMSVVGDIGFDDIVGLAFHPDGSLWGWAKQGLLEIDTDIGHGTLKVSENRPIYGLTWNTSGTTLYATANDQRNASTLWAYTADGWQVVCEGLPQKVEALETLPNDLLVYGFENDTQLGIHTLDVETCQTLDNARIETPYYDIEGIAWPTHDCPPSNLEALRTYFESVEAEDIIINHDGAISVLLNDERFYGQLAEEIEKTTPPSDGLLVFSPIDDANADDQDDYLITYPNGDQQILYYLGNGETPEPFEFTDVEYAVADTEYTSNTITIKGLMTETTAIVSGDLKTSLIKNGVDTGLTSITVVNGDTLAVKTHSGSASRTRSFFTKRFKLLIGKFSKQWTVKTPPPIKSLPETSGVKTGETAGFDVNQSGAVAYQIPIAVAPGTGGMQPKLSFTYSNHGNNGPLGVGFSLSGLSAITRCKTTLAQDGLIDGVDFDGNDKFCLDGERLMAIQGNYGAEGTEYRTEHTNFSKIQSFGVAGDGPAKFKVWTKAGLIMEYGYTENARIEAQGKSNVLFWYLNQIQDTKGNYLTFSYHENNALGESYPIRIDYTGNSNAGLTPYNSVQLIYEARPDITPQYVGGSLVSMTQRLVAVKTYEKGRLFREYRLAYQNDASTQRSHLISISECGSDGTCFEPTTFEWHSFPETQTFDGPPLYVWRKSEHDLNRVRLADFNGDGKMDVLRMDGATGSNSRIFYSNGQNFTLSSGPELSVYKGSDHDLNRVRLGDFNGDGKTDILRMNGISDDNTNIFYSTGNGFTVSSGPKLYVHRGSDHDLNRVKLADFNGDGKTDILRMDGINQSGFRIFYSSGQDFTVSSFSGLSVAWGSDHDLNRVRLGDFNGDGKTDILRIDGISSFNTRIFYSTGNSFTIASGPDLYVDRGSEHDLNRVKLGDFNGDGKTDILRIDGISSFNSRIFYSTGNGFTISSGPDLYVDRGSEHDLNRVKLGDFNGDGKTDILRIDGISNSYFRIFYSTGQNFTVSSLTGLLVYRGSDHDLNRIRLGDFNGDGKTDILRMNGISNESTSIIYPGGSQLSNFLSTITNAHGAKIEIDYKPLTDNSIYTKQAILNDEDSSQLKKTGCNGDIQLPKDLCEGLIAYYPLNGNANDASGNGHNGLEKGGLDYVSGQQEQAAHFDGVNNYIEIADSSNLHFDTDALTVSMWLNAKTFSGKDRAHEGIRLLSKNGYPKTWWVTDILPNGQIQMALKDSDGVRILEKKSTTAVTTNKWYHLVVVLDRRHSELRYYLNGKLDARHTLSDLGDISINGATIEIGSGIFNPFNGLIDELYLHRRVLTDAEIQDLYNPVADTERDFQGPIYVVSSYKTSNGIGGQNEITFRYGGAKLDSHGRGFRGFRWVEKTDQQTGLSVTSYYDQDHRYTGSPLLKQEQRLADGTLLSETHNSLAFNDQGGIFSAYVKSSQTTSYDLDGSHIATVTTKQDYDDYGNLTQATTTHDDGYTQTTTNTYLNDTANWFLGRLTNTVVSKQVVGQAAQTRTSAFEYDPDSGLLTKEIIEPNHASLRLEKSYQHDAYGNIIQSTTSGPDIDARSHFTRYDQDGRFVIESQNALGHTESKRYQMGNLVALTGPNKLTTTWFYDSFGRKMLEKRADGTETQTAYLLCEDSCPASATYYRKTTTSGAAPTQVYYDHLDRVVRETTLGFDNRPIHVDTQYDERGQIKRVSEPYFEKESPVWTVNEYDILGRVIKQTAPDNSITTTRYEGFTTVVTNPLGQTQTRTVNSRQQMIESLDHFNHSLTYIYDGFGKLLELRDPMGNVTEIAYDQRGNKIKMIDPDTGTSRYQYNALGELVAQTDAKGQTVQMRYDQLGRLIWRQEPEGLSTWTYDTRPKGIGKLAQLTGPNGYQELYTYGHFGRLTETLTTIGEQHYPISKTYDQYGRVDSLTYPTGFAVRNLYDNAKGYLLEVQRASDHHVYWRAEQRNARGQLEQVSLGNGLVTQSVYDKLTGRIQAIETSDLQNLQFSFDRLGNLTQRRKDNLVENFRYDALNRLIQTSVEGGQNTHIGYDALGNITYKSDVGNYSYGSRPHAVTAVSGHLNQAYRYDANGNRLSSTTGTVAYTSFNKPHTITEGHTTLQFLYGPNYSRYQKTVIKDSVTESVKTYIGGLYEQAISDTLTKDIHYIFAGSDSIAIETQSSDGNHSTRYLHKDHLGSIEAITDEQGALVESFSFDAWGKRRAANWNALSEEALRNLIQEGFQTTSRGFTGHEHLDEVQLIHMNGRVYDPVIGRFISADPIVQAPANLQNLNRYSYVLNNPLSLVDPSGFIFKKLFKGIKKFLKKFKKEFIFLIGVATAGLASWAIGTLAGQVGAVTSAIVSGAGFNFGTSFAGTLAYGGNLKDAFRAGFKAGFIGGISAGLSQWVNTAFKNNFLPRAIGRSVVNGAANVMSGGSFKDGFRQSFVNDALNVGYKKLVGAPPSLLARQEGQTEDTALRSSEPQVGFNNSDKPILGAKSSLNKWVARNIPLFNAIAIAHDKMLDVLGASPNTASKFFLNIPTMPIALAATPGAYMSQISVTYQFPNRAK